MTMTEPAIDVTAIPRIEHREAMQLAETAYARFVDLAETVRSEQWGLPTDCTGWTVRDMVGHVLGAMRSAASMRELMSQQLEVVKRVRAGGTNQTDAMTQIQIDRTAALGTADLLAESRRMVAKATAGRRRTPAPMRSLVRVKVDLGFMQERWSLGYLNDVILTRDAWLHRIDLSRALGVEPVVTADHDGRIVADIVAEWARRHGKPFVLTLTGPAGGRFVSAATGEAEHLDLDAVEYCRILSGRSTGTGLLATAVPF